MSSPSQAILDASALIRARRFAEARARLESHLTLAPATVQALWLLGGACQELGDADAALAAFSRLLEMEPRWVPARVARAELLARAGRTAAEAELRRALADDPRFTRAATSLAQLLRLAGRTAEALDVTTAALPLQDDEPGLLVEHALALQAAQRGDEALAALERAVRRAPQRGDAQHYLALALHARGAHGRAIEHARLALAAGQDGAETRGVLARALAAAQRLDEAEDAFREGLARDPDATPLHEDYARLLWLRSGDLERACAALDAALARTPQQPALWAIKAQLTGSAGDHARAYTLYARAAALAPAQAEYELAASTAALKAQPEHALSHARRAAAIAPDLAREGLIQALLVDRRWEEAQRELDLARDRQPEDQQLLALQAVLWRACGDARYRALYDYGRCVRAWMLDIPPGWNRLADYLTDLRTTLARLHDLRGHPPDQSLRGGSQTMGDLAAHSDPVIRAFFDHAMAGPLARHIAWLGSGEDALRRRNRGRGHVHAAWSVRLRPQGYHVDHVHPDGWLSSACYIEVPDTLGDGEDDTGEECRAGWIRFGAVPLPLDPPLRAEHYVRPQPGLLVLFPSYMWHGTVPFPGRQPRVTIAFDVRPGDAGAGAAH